MPFLEVAAHWGNPLRIALGLPLDFGALARDVAVVFCLGHHAIDHGQIELHPGREANA